MLTLIGAPFDGASSFLRGPAQAPDVIRAAMASPSSNLFSENLTDLAQPGLYRDAGNIELGADPRASIEAAVSAILANGDTPLVLGGDHSVTYPVVRAVSQRHAPLTILHFDAHNDLYDHFEGDRWSHACPFARIMEEGRCAQLIQAGIRGMNTHQRAQADRFGVDVVDMRRFAAGDRWTLKHPVYLSIDVDVLDPAFAPGVSHREGGGLTVRELITAIQQIDAPIVGADLVEYNPLRDIDDLTHAALGKILKELLARMLS